MKNMINQKNAYIIIKMIMNDKKAFNVSGYHPLSTDNGKKNAMTTNK